MVRFHVVDDKIVDLAIAYDLTDIFNILSKEVNLHGIYEHYLIVVDEIGIVRHSVWQWPQSFK